MREGPKARSLFREGVSLLFRLPDDQTTTDARNLHVAAVKLRPALAGITKHLMRV